MPLLFTLNKNTMQPIQKVKKAISELNRNFYQVSTQLDKDMEGFNTLLDGYGIEVIRKEGHFHHYFGDTVAFYVNMGDPYIETVFFDAKKLKFFVGDMEKACKRLKV